MSSFNLGRSSIRKRKWLELIDLIVFIGLAFIETSALDSTNVEKAFMNVIKEIY